MIKLTLKQYINILIIKEGLKQLKGIKNNISTDHKINLIKEIFYRLNLATYDLSDIELNELNDIYEINKLLGINIKHTPYTIKTKNIKIKEEKNTLNYENNQEIINIDDYKSYSNQNSYNENILNKKSNISPLKNENNQTQVIKFKELEPFHNIEKYITLKGRETNKIKYYV